MSQNRIRIEDCEKKEFLIKNIQDKNLIDAVHYLFSKEFEKAYYSVKEFQKKADSDSNHYALFLEADILYETKSFSKALKLYNRIFEYEDTEPEVRFYSLIHLGNIHWHNREFDKSIESYNKAKEFLAQSACQNNELVTYEGLANAYLYSKKYSDSEDAYNRVLKIYIENKDAKNIARIYSNLANLFYEQYQDEKAESYFLKALNTVENTEHIEVRQQVLFNLYAVNEGLKRYEKALNYLAKSNVLKDSIWNRDKVWELAEKDKEISIAKKDNELLIQKEITDAQTRRLQWGGGVLALVLLFLGTLFYSYKNKVKQNKIITAQKGELEKLNHTKNYLFSVISHDLRSPVKMLIKQQQRFLRKLKNNDVASLEETAGSTLVIAEGLKHLLNNVLHWSLEQNDQMMFDQKEQALYPIVNQVLFDFQLLAGEKNIGLETDLDEEIFISVDRESIKVVLRNLLDNAIKYTPEGGTINVSTFIKDSSCHIEIQDSGIGISEEQLKRINSLKELSIEKINRSKGVGLGLLLCTTLTRKNNGIFQVEAKLDQGTTMKITFPALKDTM